jgi:D-alanyl-D-alanine carboxypeptidase
VPAAGYDGLDFARDYTDSGLVRAISSPGALDFPPGAAWQYSNAGYVLAGIVIGRATGVFYGDLLRERIFVPLQMTSAAVTAPDGPIGYIREGHTLVPAAYVSPTLNRLADGGLCLSVLDFARWEAALCGPWGVQVASMFAETPLAGGQPSGYGLGWFLSQGEHGRVAEHDGGWQGFSTAMVRYLDQGVSAVVLANVAHADVSTLAHRLAAASMSEFF